jgi:phosphatidylinositol alpha-1,6-mannosyltransferase
MESTVEGLPVRHGFVTQDYGPDLGGIARRHVELCRRLSGGVIVSTVAHAGSAAFDSREPYAIARQPFDITDAKRFANQVRWARTLPRTRVLHVGNIRPAGYPVWWAHRTTGLPYIVYVYGMDLLKERRKLGNPLKRYTARRLFADAAGVVAISAWTAELAADVMRVAGVTHAPPVATIDLGTDPDFFHPHRRTGALRRRFGLGSGPLMLTVARLVPHKGQDVAIRALALLRADVHYLIVGAGPDRPRLRALATELGVADRVTFAGALDDGDIADAYATASVYVGLSRRDGDVSVEGFGISFVEAGASGTPSVAGDSGGVRGAVRDGETGVIVPATDPGAAAAAIGALIGDESRRAAMGAAARQAVETHYNWDRVARETMAFIDTVTG